MTAPRVTNSPELVLPTLSGASFLSFGATSVVFTLDDNINIVLKVARQPGSELFRREVKIWKLLRLHAACPDIVTCFYTSTDTIFQSFCSGGNLDQRIRNNQQRESSYLDEREIVTVIKHESRDLIERWSMELTNAAAWLEALGLAHADICPSNLLLDSQDHLKLSDFDNAAMIGSNARGGAPPWVRFPAADEKEEGIGFGRNGPRIEQFAIGSVLYTMTRGHEPYDDGSIELGPIQVKMFQERQLPALGDDMIDKIIRSCWWNKYKSLQDLADATKHLPGAQNLPRATLLDETMFKEQRHYCEKLVQDGLQWGEPLVCKRLY